MSISRVIDPLDGLNPAQRRAAEAVSGPVCIFAGAGTGKTRTITHRIAHQVASGRTPPEHVLAVTFTDKAAGELRQRLAALGLPRPIRAATFHAAAWAQLRYFWPQLRHGPLPEVLASKVALLVPLARRARVEARDLAAEIEWAKARCLDPTAYAAQVRPDAPLAPEAMAEVYAAYERAKTEAGRIDYEDMLLHTADLIAQHPDIACAVRDRYRFFTVDEFQDVNPAQWRLLRAWLGDRDELCVVGDDDQTIYQFTGATPDYLRRFRDHFPGARVVTLTENYRSTPQVLALANRVLWTKKAGRKQLRPTLPDGPAPAFTAYDDGDAEVVGTLAHVARLIADGVAPGDIAVCYRVNSQSEPFEEALRGAGIPYVVRGAGGFFQRPEVRQAVTALAAVARREPAPADPSRSVADAVGAAPAERTGALVRDVERVLRDALSWSPRREPAGAAARERWRNLGALVELAGSLAAAQPDLDLDRFVADLRRRAAEGHDAADERGAVTLLTLHKAKGLEFDAVFLVACEEGLLPISHATTDEEVEEERRLLYVGVTRARRHLHISWADRRVGRSGRPAPRRVSRFLYNLGAGAPASGGAGVRHGRRSSTSRTQAPAAPALADLSPEDAALAAALRDWRRRRASDDGMPAFVVFDDRTLAGLAAARPATPEQLLAVRGFGPAKLERYGDDVLAAIRQHGGP